jgi:PAS domain S-box-containing protein
MLFFLFFVKPVENMQHYNDKIYAAADTVIFDFRKLDTLFQKISLYQKQNHKKVNKVVIGKNVAKIRHLADLLELNIKALNKTIHNNKSLQKFFKPLSNKINRYWNNIAEPIISTYLNNYKKISRKMFADYLVINLEKYTPYFQPFANKAMITSVRETKTAEYRTMVIFIGINVLFILIILTFLYFLVNDRTKLKEQKELFNTISKNLTSGIILYNAGKILFSNTKADEILGYSEGELQKVSVFDIADASYHDQIKKTINEGLRENKNKSKPVSYIIKCLKKDGTNVWLNFQAATTCYKGKFTRFASFSDVTDSKMLEDKLKDLEAVFLTSAITIEDLTESMFSSLKGFIKINRLSFANIKDNNVVANVAFSDAKNIMLEAGFSQPLSEVSLKNLKKNDIRIINDIEKVLELHPASKSTRLIYKEGMRSSLTFPIYNNDELKGFLFLNSFDKNAFNIKDIEKLKYLSKFIITSYEKTLLVSTLIKGIILGFAKIVEEKDEGTMNHIFRVSSYSKAIAKELSKNKKFSIDGKYIADIYSQASLHDIGKISIPDSILLKKGKLTPEEFEIMKKHTIIGYEILDNINKTTKWKRGFFEVGKFIAKYHQEKWDGSGYPEGLAGDKIPLCARITSVADVFDALTSERPYKKAFDFDESYNIIIESSGQHFDPNIVSAFVNIKNEIKSIYYRYANN